MTLDQVTLVSIAICDLCRAKETHASSSSSPSATEYLTKLGWRLFIRNLVDGNQIGAMCPACAPLWPLTPKAK